MKYLIDTDWVINHLRGTARVTEKLGELADSGLALSIISLAELYEGVYRSTNPDKAEKSLSVFLTAVTVLGINGAVCRVFGRERARLRKEGLLIGDFDLLIASTCLHHNLILLTDNVREFERVQGIRLLE
ncbi:MAG: type II toxin-antitoxin system VapC family toxin [Chloroflexi bacterium]|nr:type II toxin-antitoxin system VapC family toxin [Chloroflexota bacterium]